MRSAPSFQNRILPDRSATYTPICNPSRTLRKSSETKAAIMLPTKYRSRVGQLYCHADKKCDCVMARFCTGLGMSRPKARRNLYECVNSRTDLEPREYANCTDAWRG